ncbi:MAG: hypothetical protein KAX31_05335, partial [Thermoplasmata archaeon]|nr:hypothetical protein [Thermoplasmata archaeon]
MAAMLIGLPGFALLSSGAEPLNDVTDEFIEPIILNMMEDNTLQLDLTDYFHAKWMTMTISGQDHLSCVIDGVMLTISPSQDWYGGENIVITAIYPLQTLPPGVPLPSPLPPPGVPLPP